MQMETNTSKKASSSHLPHQGLPQRYLSLQRSINLLICQKQFFSVNMWLFRNLSWFSDKYYSKLLGQCHQAWHELLWVGVTQASWQPPQMAAHVHGCSRQLAHQPGWILCSRLTVDAWSSQYFFSMARVSLFHLIAILQWWVVQMLCQYHLAAHDPIKHPLFFQHLASH